RGWFGKEPTGREDVLRAFAPRARGAPLPRLALETDVLIATDILSEGLNLQDAVRVIHYDLPWSPARLAQRVGRIDRAGSPHERIETVTFLPPPSLADALAMERRLVTKRRMQSRAGAGPRGFDWCDRLQGLAGAWGTPGPPQSSPHPVGAGRGTPCRHRATPKRPRTPRWPGVATRDRHDGGRGATPRRSAGSPRAAVGARGAGLARSPAADRGRRRATAGRADGGAGARVTVHS